MGRVLADHPAAPLPPPRAVRPPRELVARFRSSAAPRAVQLAVYLSAAPLTLPVMRLVQRTMLPDSEPSDLAEVLLSGLLRRSAPGSGHWYEFVPGVQDVLLGPLGRDEAALVLKHCSEYVLAHFGRGVRNFPALAVSQLTGTPPAVADPGPEEDERAPEGRLPQAFAQVSAKVVRRYLPGMPEEGPAVRRSAAAPVPTRAGAVRAARDRLADADAAGDGGARALYEAVAVLRRAVTAPPGPGDPPEEAETELAGALLRLWTAQRDPELLAEAERAVTGLRTARAGAVLGRVLFERALAAGPDAELLAAADMRFAAAGAEADPELRRDCAVRRAETLIRLSGLRDEAGALREARAALEPLAGPAPGSGPYPGSGSGPGSGGDGGGGGPAPYPELHLALGRVLLALLPRTPDPAERTALAEQAAARLAAALTVAPTAPDRAGPGTAQVRVELADALRHLPGRLEEAAGQLDAALTEVGGDPELRVTALVCLARVHRARYARDIDPAALEDAAEAYGRARRLIPATRRPSGNSCPSGATYSWSGPGPPTVGRSPGPPYASCARAGPRSRSPTPVRPTGCCGWPPGCGCGTRTRATRWTCGRPSTCWSSPSGTAATRWNRPASGGTTATSSRRSTATPGRWNASTGRRTPTGGPGGPLWRPTSRTARTPPSNWPPACSSCAGTCWNASPGPAPPWTPTARRWSCGRGPMRAPQGARKRSGPGSRPWRPRSDARAEGADRAGECCFHGPGAGKGSGPSGVRRDRGPGGTW